MKVLIATMVYFVAFSQFAHSQAFRPAQYTCYRTADKITIDGFLDEGSWLRAPFTDLFVDIEGNRQPLPWLGTRAKMLWDEEYMYFAAVIEEPNVWATLAKRDTVICDDCDFEIFIDPDNDGRNYLEFEINAFNVVWDLKKFDKGHRLESEWDIEELRTAIQVNGTLNQPRDIDKGWTVEVAWPMKSIKAHARDRSIPPVNGQEWRINFSRVEFLLDDKTPYLKRIPGRPSINWVWSPHGLINMHWPEAWGFVTFSTVTVGYQNDTEATRARPGFHIPDLIRKSGEKPGSMVLIPGGTFSQGPDPLAEWTSPSFKTEIKEFNIDRFEVTVSEYTAFLNAIRDKNYYYKHMACEDCGIVQNIGGTFSVSPGRENYPVVYVTIDDARAYAKWAGKRLPTESEWERACRFDDSRYFPWGNQKPDEKRANFNYIYGKTLPVGTLSEGKTLKGIYDMAGNVAEIVEGRFEAYPGGQKPDIHLDVVYRGGSWASPEILVNASVREIEGRNHRSPYIGFRCAIDVIK